MNKDSFRFCRLFSALDDTKIFGVGAGFVMSINAENDYMRRLDESRNTAIDINKKLDEHTGQEIEIDVEKLDQA